MRGSVIVGSSSGSVEAAPGVLAPREEMSRTADAALGGADLPPPSVREVYDAHGEFVWRSLARLGISDADLLDASQEVFLVVHRRIDSWQRQGKLTSWLFGICLRVAAAHRRRAFRRREVPSGTGAGDDEPTLGPADAGPGPEERASLAEARRTLEEILDRLPLEQRAVLVMYEIDELSCAEIAEQLDIPVGTVHSRLHHARKSFQAAVHRARARSTRPSRRTSE